MSLLLDLIAFFIVGAGLKFIMMGLGAFLVIPLLGVILPWRFAKVIVNQYHSLAMALLGRAILLQRSHGSLKLKKAVFDPKFAAEKIYIKGKPRYFEDPNNLMSTFKNRSFGIAHEDRAVIVDARTPYYGRRYAELKNSGNWMVDGHRKAYFAIKEGMRELVNLRDIKAIIQNPGEPNVPERVDTYAEKGQAGFNTGTLKQQGQLLVAAGAGMGMMWFVSQIVQSGGADVGRMLPIIIGVF